MARKYTVTIEHRKLFAELMASGRDPISTLCDVLADESVPLKDRRKAARLLKPYYHPRLATMGPLIEVFGDGTLCGTNRGSDALN